MDRENPLDALRRTHIPVGQEYLRTPGEADDPLGEDHDSAVPGLVHRYPDRVLFLSTGFCSTYCRYCTRSRMVGEAGGDYQFSVSQWDRALAYIEAHPEVRDVLLSGGDPLTIADEKLDYLLGRLRAIKHVEFIRLGTKVPTVLPMRITKSLTKMLRKHHRCGSASTSPILRTDARGDRSLRQTGRCGHPAGSQTVLLKGINDSVDTMKRMVHGLLMRRVKPYYLYQCDPSPPRRISVRLSRRASRSSRGCAAIPPVRGTHFVIDAPGAAAKFRCCPSIWWVATATMSCSAISRATSIAIPTPTATTVREGPGQGP